MGPSRALPSVLSPNSSNVKLSDSVTKVSGFHRMMVKWLSRLDLPSPMMRVQKDGIQLRESPPCSYPLTSTISQIQIQNNDFYQKMCSGGSQLLVQCCPGVCAGERHSKSKPLLFGNHRVPAPACPPLSSHRLCGLVCPEN